MPLVKLKDKGQVTIPAAIREAIAAHQGDIFDVVVKDGNIVLRPQDVVSRGGQRPKSSPDARDISPYIGAAKGIFGSPDEIEAYIRAARDEWT